MRSPFFLAIAMLLPASAMAQCPGGVCPTYQPSVQYQSTYSGPFFQRSVTRTVQPYQPIAVAVKIESRFGDRVRHGTGTVIRYAGRLVILTCAHILGDGWAIRIKSPQGWECGGTVLHTDGTKDLACILPDRLPADAKATVVAPPPQQKQNVTYGGYSERGFVAGFGLVRGYLRRSVVVRGETPEGTSGGPIWTKDGVVGVITENQHDGESSVVGPCEPAINEFLDEALVEPEEDPVTQEVPQKAPPVPVPDFSKVMDLRLVPIEDKIDDLAGRVAALEALPASPGPVGPRGPEGLTGPQGPRYELTEEDTVAIASVVMRELHIDLLDGEGNISETLFANADGAFQLPPVRMQTYDKEEVASEAAVPLGTPIGISSEFFSRPRGGD